MPPRSSALALPRHIAELSNAGRRVSVVDGQRARAYAAATNDANGRYSDGSGVVPPVFAVVPAWEPMFGAVVAGVPAEHLPMLLHAEHDMRFVRPLAAGMNLATEAGVSNVRVRRSGTWLTVRVVSTDEDSAGGAGGGLVVEQFASMFVRGWLAEEDLGADRPAHGFPDGARARPVAEVVRHVDDDQTFRYRDASGDTNPIHIDDEYARGAGLPGIIVHGLCTMAMCGSAVVDTVAGGDPARLGRLAVRFSKPVFPGTDLMVHLYDAGGGAYAFEAASDGVLVVKDGIAEVRA